MRAAKGVEKLRLLGVLGAEFVGGGVIAGSYSVGGDDVIVDAGMARSHSSMALGFAP
jgi:hypothetical protein